MSSSVRDPGALTGCQRDPKWPEAASAPREVGGA